MLRIRLSLCHFAQLLSCHFDRSERSERSGEISTRDLSATLRFGRGDNGAPRHCERATRAKQSRPPTHFRSGLLRHKCLAMTNNERNAHPHCPFERAHARGEISFLFFGLDFPTSLEITQLHASCLFAATVFFRRRAPRFIENVSPQTKSPLFSLTKLTGSVYLTIFFPCLFFVHASLFFHRKQRHFYYPPIH